MQIPILHEMLIKKDRKLTELSNSSNITENCQSSEAIVEINRERAAIDRAIEVNFDDYKYIWLDSHR